MFERFSPEPADCYYDPPYEDSPICGCPSTWTCPDCDGCDVCADLREELKHAPFWCPACMAESLPLGRQGDYTWRQCSECAATWVEGETR